MTNSMDWKLALTLSGAQSLQFKPRRSLGSAWAGTLHWQRGAFSLQVIYRKPQDSMTYLSPWGQLHMWGNSFDTKHVVILKEWSASEGWESQRHPVNEASQCMQESLVEESIKASSICVSGSPSRVKSNVLGCCLHCLAVASWGWFRFLARLKKLFLFSSISMRMPGLQLFL